MAEAMRPGISSPAPIAGAYLRRHRAEIERYLAART